MPSTQLLLDLFQQWSGKAAEQVELLPAAGSDRRYYRLQNAQHRAIGTLNVDLKENQSFLRLSERFLAAGLPVPEIYSQSPCGKAYLQQDLGDQSLLQVLKTAKKEGNIGKVKVFYEKSVEALTQLQLQVGPQLTEDFFYKKKRFDVQQMRWDMHYFKYYFLKLLKIELDEEKLERDFEALAHYLEAERNSYFLYRDFQARNILIHEEQPYFIDYQGGMWGPPQYDLAALLFQAKAELPTDWREELLDHYIEAAQAYAPLQPQAFKERFYAFVLLRSLQVLGAYGFHGLYGQKAHFLSSIPYALRNVDWLLRSVDWAVELPYLFKLLSQLPEVERLQQLNKPLPEASESPLKVEVYSFSYKKELPPRHPKHGGGFLFDCRSLLNPGRQEAYKTQTGRDAGVQQFLKEKSKVDEFLAPIYQTVSRAVEVYLKREFDYLLVGFGCTGGQHRSVYCADQMAAYLRERYGLEVQIRHIVQEQKNWKND